MERVLNLALKLKFFLLLSTNLSLLSLLHIQFQYAIALTHSELGVSEDIILQQYPYCSKSGLAFHNCNSNSGRVPLRLCLNLMIDILQIYSYFRAAVTWYQNTCLQATQRTFLNCTRRSSAKGKQGKTNTENVTSWWPCGHRVINI